MSNIQSRMNADFQMAFWTAKRRLAVHDLETKFREQHKLSSVIYFGDLGITEHCHGVVRDSLG